MPLTTGGGRLRSVGEIAKILSKKGLHDLGFDIPRGKVMAREAIMPNRVEKELPSMSNVAKVDDIKNQRMQQEGWIISFCNLRNQRICPCTKSKTWTNSSEALEFPQAGNGKEG